MAHRVGSLESLSGPDDASQIAALKLQLKAQTIAFNTRAEQRLELLRDLQSFFAKQSKNEIGCATKMIELVDQCSKPKRTMSAAAGALAATAGKALLNRIEAADVGGAGVSMARPVGSSSFGGDSSTDGGDAFGGDGVGQPKDVWRAILDQTRNRGEARIKAAEAIARDVNIGLAELETTAKDSAVRGAALLKSLQAEVERLSKDVESKHKAYTTDQNKFTKTSDKKDALYQKGKTASKEGVAVKEKMITRERKANDARTDYLLAIAAANAGIKNFFEIEMPSLVDSLDQDFHTSLLEVFQAVNAITTAEQQHAREGCAVTLAAATAMSAVHDSAEFFKKNGPSFKQPKPFIYGVCGDDHSDVVSTLPGHTDLIERYRKLENTVFGLEQTIAVADGELAKVTGGGETGELVVVFTGDSVAALDRYGEAYGRRATASSQRTAVLAELTLVGRALSRLGASPTPGIFTGNRGIADTADSMTFIKPQSIARSRLYGYTAPSFVQGLEVPGEDSPDGKAPRASPRPARRAGETAVAPGCKFGTDLISAARISGSPVPLAVTACIAELSNATRLVEEGMFRVPGGAAEVKEIKEQLEAGTNPFLTQASGKTYETHAIAGCLKAFLRDLPDSVMHSSSSYDKWISIAKQPASCDKLAAAYTMTNGTIPSEHAAVLKVLLPFLELVTRDSERNKMSLPNIALVFGPTLLPAPAPADGDLLAMQAQMSEISTVNRLISYLIENRDALFAGSPPVENTLEARPRGGTGSSEKPRLTGKPLVDRGKPPVPVSKRVPVVKVLDTERYSYSVTALYAYTARSSDECSFAAGDVIMVEPTPYSNDWWNSEGGFVATSYVEPSPTQPHYKTDSTGSLKSGGEAGYLDISELSRTGVDVAEGQSSEGASSAIRPTSPDRPKPNPRSGSFGPVTPAPSSKPALVKSRPDTVCEAEGSEQKSAVSDSRAIPGLAGALAARKAAKEATTGGLQETLAEAAAGRTAAPPPPALAAAAAARTAPAPPPPSAGARARALMTAVPDETQRPSSDPASPPPNALPPSPPTASVSSPPPSTPPPEPPGCTSSGSRVKPPTPASARPLVPPAMPSRPPLPTNRHAAQPPTEPTASSVDLTLSSEVTAGDASEKAETTVNTSKAAHVAAAAGTVSDPEPTISPDSSVSAASEPPTASDTEVAAAVPRRGKPPPPATRPRTDTSDARSGLVSKPPTRPGGLRMQQIQSEALATTAEDKAKNRMSVLGPSFAPPPPPPGTPRGMDLSPTHGIGTPGGIVPPPPPRDPVTEVKGAPGPEATSGPPPADLQSQSPLIDAPLSDAHQLSSNPPISPPVSPSLPPSGPLPSGSQLSESPTSPPPSGPPPSGPPPSGPPPSGPPPAGPPPPAPEDSSDSDEDLSSGSDLDC